MTTARAGKVQTVLGLIEPEQVGMTMMHEHLLIDMRCRCQPPEGDPAAGELPYAIERRMDILQDPAGNRDTEDAIFEQIVREVEEGVDGMDVRCGGWGYGHILKRVVPRFRLVGLGDDELRVLLVDNPRRLLTFTEPVR